MHRSSILVFLLWQNGHYLKSEAVTEKNTDFLCICFDIEMNILV